MNIRLRPDQTIRTHRDRRLWKPWRWEYGGRAWTRRTADQLAQTVALLRQAARSRR